MSSNDEPADSGSGDSTSRMRSVSDIDLVDVNLGDASKFVSGGSADWVGLVTFLLTIPILIASEALARLVAGLFTLPRLAITAAGDVYSRLIELAVGAWPEIFSVSFQSTADAVSGTGLSGFVIAVIFVITWYLILTEVLEVL